MMTCNQEKKQTRTSSKTKARERHLSVFGPTVPPKIILPKHWFIEFAADPDGANPVVLAQPMYGLHMTL